MRREEERVVAEERRQALLRRKLPILQICLASPWAIEQMAKDPDDPMREMAAQGIEDLEKWSP